MKRELEDNRRRWDELTPIHYKSSFYDVPSFLSGKTSLAKIERGELTDVAGKSLLHLQCHFGLDTLSWARDGATVTGVDFSGTAIKVARDLARQSGIEARFIESDIYELDLKERFDIVFTSYGVLGWLPDLAGWARLIAAHLKPGGRFYIAEIHPFAACLAQAEGGFHAIHPYGGSAHITEATPGSYVDRHAEVLNQRTHEWCHGLGEIVSALIGAGLSIRFLHEHEQCCFQMYECLTRGEDGLWRLPPEMGAFPMLFSLLAERA